MASETADERVQRLIPSKCYLGDGAYVESAGYSTAALLTAENGVSVQHKIMLEPEVWRALKAYMVELESGVTLLLRERAEEASDAHD